jgi:hypothetical protein
VANLPTTTRVRHPPIGRSRIPEEHPIEDARRKPGGDLIRTPHVSSRGVYPYTYDARARPVKFIRTTDVAWASKTRAHGRRGPADGETNGSLTVSKGTEGESLAEQL